MPIQAKVGWRAYVSPVTASYLLDSYSGAGAAYSLRKLRTTYSGPAIRVRRSSDNTEQNIGFDASGNLDTTALLSFVGAGNGFVTTWYDQSGNNLHFAQSTAANQPSIVINSAVVLTLGEPAVRFNSTDKNYLEIPSSTSSFNFLHNGTDSTVISVGRYNFVTNPGTDSTLISNGGNGSATVGTWVGFSDVSPLNNCFGVSISRGVGGIGDGATHTAQSMVSDTALPYTKQNLHFVNINAGAAAIDRIKVQYDNNTIAKSNIRSNTPSTANATNNMMMGVYIQGGVKYSSLEGDVQELIIYNSNQDTNRTGITSNINAHYSIYSNVSSLLTSLYAAYNADSAGSSSLKTSLFAAYNGESNANDSFGSNNGTAQGGLTYTAGKIGNAFDFNGTNAYVGIPNTSGQLDFIGDFSISTWVMPLVTSASFNVYFGNHKSGGAYGSGYVFYLDRNVNKLKLTIGAQNSYVEYFYNWIPLVNTWYHLTVTRKKSTGTKFYINGVEVIGQYTGIGGTSTLDPTYQTGQIYNIGSVLNGSSLGNYRQDAVNVWNKELTQTEITELYNSGNGAQYITNDFYKPTPNDALNTYNGTAQGGLTYGLGKVGTAFQFNGTNAHVSFTAGSFNSLTTDFSVSAWVYLPIGYTSANYCPIFSNMSAPGWFEVPGGFWLMFAGTTIQLAIGGKINPTFLNYNISSDNLLGTWIHVVAVRKNNTSNKIYINNVLKASYTNTNPASLVNPVYYTGVNLTTPTIGNVKMPNGVQNGYYAYNGSKIDAVGIWNKELSASEVTELYNSGNGKQYPN